MRDIQKALSSTFEIGGSPLLSPSSSPPSFRSSLLSWFGHRPGTGDSRIVASSFYRQQRSLNLGAQAWSAAEGFKVVQELLLSGSRYRSVLFWRFDMPPTEKITGDMRKEDIARFSSDPSVANLNRLIKERVNKLQQTDNHDHLKFGRDWLLLSGDRPMAWDDQFFSFPGWLMPCMVAVCLRESCDLNPFNGDMFKYARKQLSSTKNQVVLPEENAYGHYASIYRGPYGISHHDGGPWLCRYLRKYFNSPSCGAVYMASELCRTLKARFNDSRAFLAQATRDFAALVQQEDTARADKDDPAYSVLPHERMREHNLLIPAPDEKLSVLDDYLNLGGCWASLKT